MYVPLTLLDLLSQRTKILIDSFIGSITHTKQHHTRHDLSSRPLAKKGIGSKRDQGMERGPFLHPIRVSQFGGGGVDPDLLLSSHNHGDRRERVDDPQQVSSR